MDDYEKDDYDYNYDDFSPDAVWGIVLVVVAFAGCGLCAVVSTWFCAWMGG